MHTVDDVKAKLTEYMMSVDLAKLRFDDLASYAEALETLAKIGKDDYVTSLVKAMTPNYQVCAKPEGNTQTGIFTMGVKNNA